MRKKKKNGRRRLKIKTKKRTKTKRLKIRTIESQLLVARKLTMQRQTQFQLRG